MTDWNHFTPLATAGAFAQAMIPLRVEGADPTNPALDTFEQVTLASVIAAAASSSSMSAGQPVSIDLFVNLTAHALPAAVTAFIAGGFSNGGVGGGIYVADSLATAALASSCPRFCAADSTGRYFRLVAHHGKIAISQAGALGGANNDQPAVQAAIAYCQAIGCRELLWDFDTVSLWNPLRTSAPDAFALDGQSIVVSAPIKFTGLPTQTRIKLLSMTGLSLETNFQNVGGALWRGSGIKLMGGTQSAPNSNNLAWFAMENIWLDGGCLYTGATGTPTPSSPDGRDLYNKGLHLQGTQCDNITLLNCRIDGFKGEACYVAGTTQTFQFYDHCKISGSNQSAMNPSAGNVRATDCEFGNSFIALECLGGVGSLYQNCLFYGSVQCGATGGPANGLLYSYAYPTRDLTKAPPWVDFIACEFRSITQLTFANYVRVIKPRVTDCQLVLNTAIVFGAFTSTYITGMDYTIDQMTANPICSIQGPPSLTTQLPGAPAGTYIPQPSDIHIDMSVHRTANAIANNYYANVYGVSGYMDVNCCSLAVREADGVQFVSIPNYPTTQNSLPLVTCDGPSSSQAFYYALPFAINPMTMTAGPYAIPVSGPRHGLQNTGATASIACTMATTFAYATGQKTRIYYVSSTSGTTFTFAHNGAGLRLSSDCVLAVPFDWIELEYNGSTGLWHETGRQVHAA